MNQEIAHDGIIRSIEENRITVQIVQHAACADCHAKAACSLSEEKEKLIHITSRSGLYNIGEKVTIMGSFSMGLKAVCIAFVFPLLGVLAVLFLCIEYFHSEVAGALGALLLLGVYYVLLFLMKGKLDRQFIFRVIK